MNACVSAVPQGLMGNKGEPGNPGLPGFSGPKGPAVSTALFLTLPSHVVGERVSHWSPALFCSCVSDLRILPNLTFDPQGPHGPAGPEGKQVGVVQCHSMPAMNDSRACCSIVTPCPPWVCVFSGDARQSGGPRHQGGKGEHAPTPHAPGHGPDGRKDCLESVTKRANTIQPATFDLCVPLSFRT